MTRQPGITWAGKDITDVTNQPGTYVNFNGGTMGDYHLSPNSPGKAQRTTEPTSEPTSTR